jgi:pilus assembly protein CpaE
LGQQESKVAGERVLFIDDDEQLRVLVQVFLTRSGYQVTTAADGHQALSLIEKTKPALILADVNMPGLNGLELTRTLRRDAETATTPIVLLSASNETADILAGYKEGADEYIAKPINLGVLLAKVESALRRVTIVTPNRGGVVTVFVHGKGGVGTTTLLVNSAVALAASQTGKRVAILDLNLEFGNAEILLDLHPTRRLTQLALMDLGELHPSQFEAFLEKHSSGVNVLAAPESAVDAEHITVGIVQWAINRLRDEADYVLIDLPATFSELTLAAIDTADAMCVVTSPHIAAAKATLEYLNVVEKLHVIPHDRVFLAINHPTDTGLDDEQITRFLRRTANAVIPYAAQLAKTANEGRPFVTGYKDHPSARALVDLSLNIAGVQTPKRFERQLWTG